MNFGWQWFFLCIFQVLSLIFVRTLHLLSYTGTSLEGWGMQVNSIRLATSFEWAALLSAKFPTNGKIFIKVSDCGVMRVGSSYLLFNPRLLSEMCLSFSWRSKKNNPAEIILVARRREFWFNKFILSCVTNVHIFSR